MDSLKEDIGRSGWIFASIICVVIIMATLIISMACPWYYVDVKHAKETGKDHIQYWNFYWEGADVTTNGDDNFYGWTHGMMKHADELHDVMSATIVFVVFAFLHAFCILIPLAILAIPFPTSSLNLGGTEIDVAMLRTIAYICSIASCACIFFWLFLGWMVFFGFTDAISKDDGHLCRHGGELHGYTHSPHFNTWFSPIFQDSACKSFSGVDNDESWGPSAGWVFTFFSLIYLAFLLLCLLMSQIGPRFLYKNGSNKHVSYSNL